MISQKWRRLTVWYHFSVLAYFCYVTTYFIQLSYFILSLLLIDKVLMWVCHLLLLFFVQVIPAVMFHSIFSAGIDWQESQMPLFIAGKCKILTDISKNCTLTQHLIGSGRQTCIYCESLASICNRTFSAQWVLPCNAMIHIQ